MPEPKLLDVEKMKASRALLDFHFALLEKLATPAGSHAGGEGTARDDRHLLAAPGSWLRFAAQTFFLADKAWRNGQIKKAGGNASAAPMLCRNVIEERLDEDGRWQRQFRSPWAILRYGGVRG